MELMHRNIHMNRVRYRNSYRLTVSEDVNISDHKSDVGQVVWKTGGVRINEKKLVNGKLYLKGCVPYSVLYLGDGENKDAECVRGELSFEETLEVPVEGSMDQICVRAETEELEIGVIHSRKLSVRAVLGVMVIVEEICDVNGASEISSEGSVHKRMRELSISSLKADKKDSLRLREEIFLPSGKESIKNLLYYEMVLRNPETRTREGFLEIKGDLSVFILYRKEDGGTESFETLLPFKTEVSISGCAEDMVEASVLRLTKESVNAKPDEDGEERLLEVEGVLEVEVKLYEETKLPLLSDLYATDCLLEPVYETVEFENLLMRNDSRMRFSERIEIPKSLPELLQLCRGNVEIKPELCIREGETLKLSGNLSVDVLYITEEDEQMYQSFHTELPFRHSIEIRGLTQQSTYDIHCNIADSSFQTMRNGELELKAELAFLVIAMESCSEKMITGTTRSEFDENRLEELPSMIGYPLRRNETRWDLAKRYCVAEDDIITLSEHSGEPKEGDILLIVKAAGD